MSTLPTTQLTSVEGASEAPTWSSNHVQQHQGGKRRRQHEKGWSEHCELLQVCIPSRGCSLCRVSRSTRRPRNIREVNLMLERKFVVRLPMEEGPQRRGLSYPCRRTLVELSRAIETV